MRHIALLRAVNVGGTSSVKMADLRALGDELGLSDVKTLLQSGNLTFEAEEGDTQALEARWEKAVEAAFGLATAFMIRTAPQWQALIAANPLRREAEADPAHFLVLLAKESLAPAGLEALRAAIKGRERVEASERCLYAVYPNGIGTSKLTVKMIERHLGTAMTGRNWKTVLRLGE